MGTLYLVRHGQASFGADDYDHLSELGARQCRELGAYLAAHGHVFSAVITGTLRRHEQSRQALAEGFAGELPPAESTALLNEYDSHALIEAAPGEPLPPPDSPEGYKAHFRRLRQALGLWMDAAIEPRGMPSHAAFRQGVMSTLEQLRAAHVGKSVLVISSGGPISTAVAHILDAPPAAAIDLNMRMRNSSLTEFVFSSRRMELVSFNAIPHLADPARRAWVTYA